MKKKFLLLTILAGSILLLAGCKNSRQKQTQNRAIKSSKTKKKSHEQDKITRLINQMTLDEKIGQLYFAHSNGNFTQMKNDVDKYHLGGITLFEPDFQNRNHDQFKIEMRQYQLTSKHGLFIATDQEGGTVSRLNSNKRISNRIFLSPQEIYNKDGLSGIKDENNAVAELLHSNGINMNFAPVADVAKNKNSFIYPRTLGKDYNETARYIPVAVKAIQAEKVAAVLKHFPGYGDAGDTHTGFAQINKPLNDYEKEDLLPFKAGIQANVDAVMVSHIIIKNLDAQYPASLSPAVHDLLRKKLNYRGLIITDDLEMGAITQYAQNKHINADVLALKAGNDLLLGGKYQTGIPAIKKAVEKGQIKELQIDQSLYRILKVKEKLGILK